MKEYESMIGQEESSTLEYKTVMPTSRNLAREICGFANTKGGYIFIGIQIDIDNKIKIVGLSNDFHVNSIVHKSLDLLSIRPNVKYDYISYLGKNIYYIFVEQSDEEITFEGIAYIRQAGLTVPRTEVKKTTFTGYKKIQEINEKLKVYLNKTTEAKRQLIDHYRKILKIIDNQVSVLCPENPEIPSDSEEGKVLSRILFGSFVDNFETYLSNLLYEIYLARPETLKSEQQVTVKEVLDCGDIQEFIEYIAKEKISKLQKGSVKGFIKDNKQINSLNAISKDEQNEIEKILQIRHLYTHRNGIVDEKFLKYFKEGYKLNEEHLVSVSEICNKISYLLIVIETVDSAAIEKYKLGS
ncbi:helix-turn-helix domain-containing protein [Clostridium beijerinckii]|uniref:Schlafen AlbA-2 domain-containing protein n=1 Tax=Clostridium beijerinckii TaxID=1520 RepID=A0AAE5LQ16_CLOBE|nr:ATP-binding protein [Clostridium beijerinckii]NSB14125.1 hypothetical protein [Clostridium beijerinckii]OOM23429.1 divergent AAA domain protein [Clostridium beijerinckii]